MALDWNRFEAVASILRPGTIENGPYEDIV
jgi:hypothetical protein